MLKTILHKFSTFKSLYGQAGSVNFDLIKGFHSVILHTHWEDNCEYECNPTQGYIFEDENDKSQIINHSPGLYNLQINLPEYYSYSGIINGNLIHKSTNIDAKLYGNINIECSGNYEATKIKSEVCNIKSKQLIISSTLETQYGNLDIENEISIKKLLISKKATINQQQGSLNIVAGYTQNQQSKLVIMNKNQIIDNIQNRNHLFIQSKAQQIKIGSFQGTLLTNLQTNQLNIKSLSGLFNIDGPVNVEIGITNIQSQGIIKAKSVKLNIFKELNFNIFKNGITLSEYNENFFNLYTECEELKIQLINNPFGII